MKSIWSGGNIVLFYISRPLTLLGLSLICNFHFGLLGVEGGGDIVFGEISSQSQTLLWLILTFDIYFGLLGGGGPWPNNPLLSMPLLLWINWSCG